MRQAQHQRSDVLRVEEEIRQDGRRGGAAVAGTGGRERAAEATGGGPPGAEPYLEGSELQTFQNRAKKMQSQIAKIANIWTG